VNYHFYPNDNKDLLPDKLPEKYTSQKNILDFLHDLQQKYIEKGFLAAGVDSIKNDSLNTEVFFYIGNKYTLAKINKGNIEEAVLSEIGFRERFYLNKPFSPQQVKKLFEKTLSFLENNGYPFAQVYFDSVKILNDTIFVSLKVNKGQFYKVDSVRIRGYKDFPKIYLLNQIKIKEGEPYNEKNIKELEQNISKIPFLQLAKPAEILFTDEKCYITVELKRKKSSKFDGILGFLSDRETGKLSFTGDLKFKLLNALRKAETLEFNYKGMPNSTQKLIASGSIPYLFRTPFGLSFGFDLFKKDTTFISVKTKIQADYLISANRSFSVFLENKSTSLLAQSYLKNLTTLPNYADVTSKNAGIQFLYNNTNDIIPSKGFFIHVKLSAGNKKIAQNPNINESLYANLTLNSNVYNFEWNIEKYINLKTRHVILLKNQAAQIINNQLFENELYRIGGFSLLRGFNEESIFASMYSIQTLEYHYLLEQHSYLLLFCDAGYYEKQLVNTFTHDTPYSFGAGITFETKAGIFSLIYALGSQLGNPIDVKGTKVHFGFVNYF
jgi:outer membrane protein assembly factor BamA